MRRATVIAVLWTSVARADDPPPADDAARGGALTLRGYGEADEPVLRLDPMLTTPLSETLLATVQRREAAFDLGGASHALLSAEHWKDPTSNARGVTAGLHLSHDFGFARLIVSGSMSQVDSRYESGTAVNAGIALMTMRRLSRWTTAWLSLGLNYQSWLGRPGSAGGVMLWFGMTFR